MKNYPQVSIVIVTHNRKAEVRRVIESCLAQTYPNFEVLVFDDGSTDGTVEMIAAEFPGIRLFSDENREGYIVRRNQGFREARGEHVISLDDDAFFSDPHSIEPVVEILESAGDIAAVAMNFTEPSPTPLPEYRARVTGENVRSFVGCAHAIRREVALQLDGYRELLVHQGEERDLCIRLMDHGYRIVHCSNPPIVHKPSPQRDKLRMERFGIRNTLLFDVLNVPMPHLMPRLLSDCVKLLVRKPGWPITIYRSWYLLCGLVSCLRFARLRRPVSSETYCRFISLPRHGPVKFDALIESPAENACSSIYSSSACC